MCLILFAYRIHPSYRLILLANRDEFFARPTQPLAFWPDIPEILAGRDLEAGGTWLGITRNGRFAAVTNYRDPKNISPDALSRGKIPVDYLLSGLNPQEYCAAKRKDWHQYNGFNVLAGDDQNLVWASNRGSESIAIGPGLYGLSNHLLDTGWPKVQRGKDLFRQLLAAAGEAPPALDDLFFLLQDTWQPPDCELPDTGIGPAWERLLAPIFISSDTYGTRSSLVLTVTENGEAFCCEQSFCHQQGVILETGRSEVRLNFSQMK